jgi:hypothetical protein
MNKLRELLFENGTRNYTGKGWENLFKITVTKRTGWSQHNAPFGPRSFDCKIGISEFIGRLQRSRYKVDNPDPLEHVCGNCRWNVDGVCNLSSKLHEEGEGASYTDESVKDHLIYSYYEGGCFHVGDMFGCVHCDRKRKCPICNSYLSVNLKSADEHQELTNEVDTCPNCDWTGNEQPHFENDNLEKESIEKGEKRFLDWCGDCVTSRPSTIDLHRMANCSDDEFKQLAERYLL